MTVVAPNTPKTSWIRDSGVVIEPSSGFLEDESGNYLVDESGGKLMDSVSTDGVELPHEWEGTDDPNTLWADANEPRISVATRITQQGDRRTTQQGDVRVSQISDPNEQPKTSWTNDEYQ